MSDCRSREINVIVGVYETHCRRGNSKAGAGPRGNRDSKSSKTSKAVEAPQLGKGLRSKTPLSPASMHAPAVTFGHALTWRGEADWLYSPFSTQSALGTPAAALRLHCRHQTSPPRGWRMDSWPETGRPPRPGTSLRRHLVIGLQSVSHCHGSNYPC